jgi:hypothetical protein
VLEAYCDRIQVVLPIGLAINYNTVITYTWIEPKAEMQNAIVTFVYFEQFSERSMGELEVERAI